MEPPSADDRLVYWISTDLGTLQLRSASKSSGVIGRNSNKRPRRQHLMRQVRMAGSPPSEASERNSQTDFERSSTSARERNHQVRTDLDPRLERDFWRAERT